MSTSLFGVGASINVNVNGTLVPQSFVGIAGQTLFNITNFTYTPGTNSLLVFINGQRQITSRDFAETSNSSFTLVEAVLQGDFVDIIGFPMVSLTAVPAGSILLARPDNIGSGQTLQAKTAERISVADFGALGNGITDDTVAVQTCYTWAGANNKNVWWPKPAVSYLLNSGSITIPKNVESDAEPGTLILVSSWALKTQIADQGVSCATLFLVIGDGATAYQALAPLTSRFSFKNISIQNTAVATNTMAFSGISGFAYLEVSYCKFYNLTRAGVLGNIILLNGLAIGSDAQTCVLEARLLYNEVYSDTVDTGQAPKFFHMLCCYDGLQFGNKIYANGAGYLSRWAGGSVSTIPVSTRGCVHVKVGFNFYRPLSTSEYNQLAKVFQYTIIGDQGDASAAPSPFNMWDCFNCFVGTFNGNSCVGGGLLFHGHADLNNAPAPAQAVLVGANSLQASGNVIVNPTNISIFNTGGDGGVDTNRAGRNINIVGNSCYCLPGFAAAAGIAFFYSFLCNNINLSDNQVQGIPRFIRSFFNKGINVGEGNVLIDVPEVVYLEGFDGATQATHTYSAVISKGTTGSVATLSLLNPGYVKPYDAGLQPFQLRGQWFQDAIAIGNVINFTQYDMTTATEAEVYLITSTLGTGAGAQTIAAWLAHKSNTTVVFVPITASNSGNIAPSVVGGHIRLTASGAAATFTGSCLKVQ